MYTRSARRIAAESFAIDFPWRLMIFSMGTVCPPCITRPATRAALMRGSSVPMKHTRTK